MHLGRHSIILTLLALAGLVSPSRAQPPPPILNVIYTFTNGASPNGGVVRDAAGNLYGTTATGGPGNFGGVFEVSSHGTLLNMIWLDGTTDGAAPQSPLISVGNGIFFGTASTGGFASNGTIFEFTSGGTFQLLAPFNSTLGDTPLGPLVAANDGWIYGTTRSGGSNNVGAIYRFNRFGEIGQVFSFNGADGANPIGGLTLGTDGNLYGTTEFGGASGLGSVFRFVPEGNFTNLYSFTNNIGAFPGAMVQAPNGNFYGTTISGGTSVAGTIFEFFTSGFVQNLYSFDVDTGSSPNSPLVAAYAGNLYGTTEQGGGFGQGAIFAIAPNGLVIDLFSFNGSDGALPRSGMVLGADGNFYGTTSQGGSNNSGVIYQLTGFPPVMIEAPASLRWVTNGTANFTTVAEGSAPLSYQWFFDGTNSIPGATNASLTIFHEQLTNSGSYTLVVSNAYGTVTNTNAVLSIAAPVVTVVPPLATVTNRSLTISGTAASPVGIGHVLYQLNSNGWFSVTGTTHWETVLTLQPGTNILQLQGFDVIGDPSALKTIKVFYATVSTLTLETNGLGSIRTSFKGSNLIVDRSYTVRGVPGKGQLFLNWSGTTSATNNPFTFVMQSNMVLQANFVTNPFIAASAKYDGLFYNTNEVTEASSGLLSTLQIEPSGAYSGIIVMKGFRYVFAGSFNVAAEQSTPTVRRLGSQGGPLELNMTLSDDEVTGTVSGTNDGGWTSTLLAERAGPAIESAEYTMLIPPAGARQTNLPPGYGYLLVTNHNGAITVTGGLADGATFSQIMSVVGDGDFPLYTSLYGNTGLLLGWLKVADGLTATNLWWIRAPSASGIYPNGFTNVISDVLTSAWTKPPANYLPSGTLTISNTSLALDFMVSITNSALLKEPGAPTNSLTGIFYPKTGLLHITFGNGTGKATTLGYAAILGASTNGWGYFLTKTNAGTIGLAP
jgi:uncharacterized repeat protein (TIGR03803 family)